MLDQRMRDRLADSLDYLCGQVGEPLALGREQIAQTVASVRAQPQSPQLFGTYYDLVFALEQDQLDRARKLARELVSTGYEEAVPTTGAHVGAIDDRPQAHAERCRRLFLPTPEMAEPPDAVILGECRRRVDDAFDLLDRGFPQLAAEIRALLREIVVATGPEDPKALTFDGASCFMLWGAILLNARGQKTVLDTAQALAHESGHNLLFGFCASGPLTDSPDDELFHSPLRADPRPMDGVIHATYVIARMHQTLQRLLSVGVLDDEQAEAARADLVLHRRNFHAGNEVIEQGGHLTELGHALMTSAREHMAS
ncbi:MAG TPA: HEXXH motif-containing putative peptide modification protein [Sphingomicrobium sp.]|jgi:HEXXH motif-containing protein|nr:HEXXH motif-containing putative peptide modification protein [Sphingomicrobium sp.]